MLDLHFDTDNAVFDTNKANVVAAILVRVSSRIAAGETAGAISDDNGNRIGSFNLDKIKASIRRYL